MGITGDHCSLFHTCCRWPQFNHSPVEGHLYCLLSGQYKLFKSTPAAMITDLSGLNNRHLFFHSSGGLKFQIMALADSVSGEDSFPGFLPLLTVSPRLSSLCAQRGLWCLFLILKGHHPLWSGRVSRSWTHLTLITFLKVLSPNTVTLGVRDLIHEFWGDIIPSVT